ncbi:MFS transporter [Pseudactinotalea sp. HY160]|uniref:MFS transporter n=1 Tax=Pseudactinotalea sp. HY160 TaxID=2654490 RepID=UPI001D158299|nr:MFS transporter [Pseudactinotalea sp. HY160]
MASTQSERATARWAAAAVMAVFFANGFAFANWASRIPTVKYTLDLEPHEVGLILLVGSLGSLLAMPLAGRVIERLGSATAAVVSGVVAVAGMGAAVAAVPAGLPLGVAGGLLVAMAGIGALDVSMNFAGTHVERAIGRAIMPWFHGFFSLGTVAGAGMGTLLSRAGVAITVHIWLALAVMLVVVLVGVRGFPRVPRRDPLPAATAAHATPATRATPGRGYLRAWLEGRTWLIGLVVLAAALTEGAANDWLALGISEGFDVPEHEGAFGLTVFMTAMTVMRFAGTWLLDRFGRVAVLRTCAGLAIAGLAVFGFAPSLPFALVGAVLWGLGAALGFPVGMSAASDDPLHAAARLSVVSTIGYSAFLVGPTLLGLLATHVGYRHALLAILVPLVIGLLVTGAMAAPEPARDSADTATGATVAE